MNEQEHNPNWLRPEHRSMLIGFANALRVMLSLRRTMPLQYVMTFLQVIQNEGITVSALASCCELRRSTMSRHLRDLGAINRHKRPGLGLVSLEQLPYGDRRESRVYLTERGATVARLMLSAFRLRSSLLPLLRSPKLYEQDRRSYRRTDELM